MLSYLIDKKEYRKEKNFEERIAGLKSICIFVDKKLRKECNLLEMSVG